MPLKEFKCPSCGNVFEKLVKLDISSEKCPKCGELSGMNYSGKCLISFGKGGGGGCGGNCSGCGGSCGCGH